MKILKNHFQDKDTIIVGKLIKNGCQTFTIEQLDEVCEKFDVPHDVKQSCLEAYTNNAEAEDFDELVQHPDWEVRSLVANQGHGLERLVNDEDWCVRAAVANQGYGLDRLVNDEDWHVRATVAKQGYGLDTLVNDENEVVCAVAVKMK